MSALPTAFPLALSACLYPPAILVLLLLLTGRHPRRLVFAYFVGAAIMTIGVGLIGLAVLSGAGATSQDSATASGWVDIVLAALLFVLARWAWRRRAREPAPRPEGEDAAPGRIATLSQRATTSQKWAFVLGLAMYLPSPMWLLAIKDIADSGGSFWSNVPAILICAAAVMLFVEIPLVAMLVRPDGVAAAMQRFHGWLTRNGWTMTAVLALAAGVYALVEGIGQLT